MTGSPVRLSNKRTLITQIRWNRNAYAYILQCHIVSIVNRGHHVEILVDQHRLIAQVALGRQMKAVLRGNGSTESYHRMEMASYLHWNDVARWKNR